MWLINYLQSIPEKKFGNRKKHQTTSLEASNLFLTADSDHMIPSMQYCDLDTPAE